MPGVGRSLAFPFYKDRFPFSVSRGALAAARPWRAGFAVPGLPWVFGVVCGALALSP
jgi:hypothetical protein